MMASTKRVANWRQMVAALLLGAAAIPAAAPAMAGAYRIDPGASVQVDVADRQYTTVVIRNLDNVPGRAVFAGRTVDVPPGGQVELYDSYGRAAVPASNNGQARLQVISTYWVMPRLP